MGAGLILCDHYRLIYSGGEERERGDGFLLDPETAKWLKCLTLSDWVAVSKLKSKAFDKGKIHKYAPTLDHCDEEIEKFYQQIKKTMQNMGT